MPLRVGCHIGCDLLPEVTPRTIPLFIGVLRCVGCDVGTFLAVLSECLVDIKNCSALKKCQYWHFFNNRQ